jgi:tricorn protease
MKTAFLLIGTLIGAALYGQINPEWMRHASISPDGQTIAFGYHGDIYTVSANGGEAKLLVGGESYEGTIIWSPDNSHLVFASDQYGNNDLFAVSVLGGNPRRLTFHSANDMPNCFSPDGKQVLFTSARLDAMMNQQCPNGAMPELYSVPFLGGVEKQEHTFPAVRSIYAPGTSLLYYQDQKGYEDDLRKHHTSSVTRDIWVFDSKTKQHTKLTSFVGEDVQPVFSNSASTMFYLSEQNGTMNVFAMDLEKKSTAQLSFMTKHPVRHLSVSNNGLLCFTHHGEIWTMTNGGTPKKVAVRLYTGQHAAAVQIMPVQGATEVAVSPNGKEVAFVSRGEVFVASVQEGTTKRITNTPEQERSVSFAPDGRSLLYAGERNGSWNIYRMQLTRTEENYFFMSTVLKEEALVSGPEETFQPSFSPNGKEIAYLEARTALKVFHIETKVTREILPMATKTTNGHRMESGFLSIIWWDQNGCNRMVL